MSDSERCAIADNNLGGIRMNKMARGDTRVHRHVRRHACVEEPATATGIISGRTRLALERGVEVEQHAKVDLLRLPRRGGHHGLRWCAEAEDGWRWSTAVGR